MSNRVDRARPQAHRYARKHTEYRSVQGAGHVYYSKHFCAGMNPAIPSDKAASAQQLVGGQVPCNRGAL